MRFLNSILAGILLAFLTLAPAWGVVVVVVQPAAGGGGGPTLVASENFDAFSNNDLLDDGADWVATSGSIQVLKPGGDGYVVPSAGGVIGIAYHTDTVNANHRAEATIQAVPAGNDEFNWIGPAVRCQVGAASAYGVVAGHDDLYLVKFNAGTQATINSDTSSTFSAGYKIAIEASGSGSATRLKVQIDTGGGWVDKWTNVDPGGTYLDGGNAGVCSWLLNDNNNQLDDWFSYDLP